MIASRLGIFILWLIHWLPLALQARIGNALGMLLYHLAAKRRKIGAINLSLCFPEWPQAQRDNVLQRHFQAMTRAAIEHGELWWSDRKRINKIVRIEGLAHFQAEYGQPLILLAPHFIGLDMGGVRISTEYAPLVSMYSRLKNPLFDQLMLHARTRFGQSKLISRHDGVRPLIREMKLGAPLYYLPDQDFGAKDALFVPFFGVPTATVNALPRIAKLAHAKVMPAVTRQLPDGQGYVIQFYPPWDNFPSDDMTADVTRMNAFIEERVREMPEQYFWLHKRFKTRPPGEAKFYP
ncbi:LpxL/LpxP family acyltransferase [Sulfuriferula thiophila]|uniref:LpxL/LpxP family acyltransferase n=1 Tax=Sulfuriferula thiophila TaxID=1781211 RepID=UPI000F612F95|nr:lipid A biosynthesis acyltransferase [Sulfuriferula thiophila]